MFWIKYHHGKDIPDYLLYPGWETDKDEDGQTVLMHWNRWRRGEAIPDALRDV